jgi:hypothetical protein
MSQHALMLGPDPVIAHGKENETGLCCCKGSELCYKELTGNQKKYVLCQF